MWMDEPEAGTGVMSDHTVCLGNWREKWWKKQDDVDVAAIGPLDDLGWVACLFLLTYLKSGNIFVSEEFLPCFGMVQIFFSFRHFEVTENLKL